MQHLIGRSSLCSRNTAVRRYNDLCRANRNRCCKGFNHSLYYALKIPQWAANVQRMLRLIFTLKDRCDCIPPDDQ